MMMNKMQFRGFVFPQNPEKITITSANKIDTHHLPGYGEVSCFNGKQIRKITCNGSFFGNSSSTPSSNMQELLSMADNESAGMLYLPGLKPTFAFLKEASFFCIEDGRILPYTLVFYEEGK